MRSSILFAATALIAAGCLADAKGDEEGIADDGKLDSFYNPTDHGPIAWNVPAHSVLTAEERYHTWTFELSGDAEVNLTTSYSLLGQRRTDTVLYLYRETPSSPTGWGPYIARNDDYGNTIYSQLVRTLGPGRYRALVKGYLSTTKGKFKLTAGCTGAGCAPPASDACLFGSTYNEIPDQAALQINNTNKITLATLHWLGADAQRKLVRAVQQSSHTDVTTPEEALARVDQGEVNVTWISETAARRSFIAFEYGAGDNSYGAIFDHHGDAMVTNIHDGDLENCTVTTETCRFPEDYPTLRDDPAFLLFDDRVITAAGQLSPGEADQVLAAIRQSYDDVTTVAEGLTRVDDNQVNLRIYIHNPTNTELNVVEFGAGDTSIGTIYYYTSLQRAGIINDSFIDACTLFAPKGGIVVGEACRGQGDCVTGVQCAGVFAGAGVCVLNQDIPGDGDECTSDAACGSAELVCAGVTRGYGLCNPAWMRGTFADATSAAIPDGGTLDRRIAVRGLATVDTDVILRTTIDHPRASQLRITLTNPATAEALVHDGTPADDGHPLVIDRPVVGFSGDEQVNGEWTLRIEDRTGGQVGTVSGWTLEVTSRYD
jgi:hypothetical protein